MQIVFANKDKAFFYSRDRKSSRSKNKDPKIGLERLLSLAARHENNSEDISIYDHRPGNPPNGKLIFQWNRGKIKVNLIQ